MIPRDKLKFNKRDLEFFDRQRDIKEIKWNDMHSFIFKSLMHHKRQTARQLAAGTTLTGAQVRQIILEIRRYRKPEYMFITANRYGYKMSCIDKCCADELITYFNKTQTRFKETFNELCNLMKLLNKIKDE